MLLHRSPESRTRELNQAESLGRQQPAHEMALTAETYLGMGIQEELQPIGIRLVAPPTKNICFVLGVRSFWATLVTFHV